MTYLLRALIAATVIAALATPAAFGASDHDAHHTASPATAAAAAPSAVLTSGEVRKVDREAKKITIRHAAIENLGMPAMTMVFHVADASLLDSVKAGEKIRFHAENPGGVLTVTRIEAQ